MISASNEKLQQQLEYTLLKPDCHSWWISKMQSGREEERYAIKFCFKLGKNAMQCKLDRLLWPRDQETEFQVEGQTEQIHPQTFDDPFFRQHWHDLHARCSHWTDSQQGIQCWGIQCWGEHCSNRVNGISTRTMQQYTIPSLSQTIWPRWASRQFLTLPIVQILLPGTFGYSLSPQAVVMRQLKRWKRLWRRSLTLSHKRTFIGPSRSNWNGTSALQPKKITSKGTRVSCMYVLSIKVPIRKKSGNLFNDPRIYIYIM